MADPRSAAEEAKRRKVRKGTHSCWECRRRKIRCQFAAGNDAVCLPCQARGSVCRSQEFIDDSRPKTQPDRRMAQRLGRLEEMMAKLVDRIMPESKSSSQGPTSPHRSQALSSAASDSEDDDHTDQALDALQSAMVDDAPVGLLLGLRNIQPSSSSPSDMLTPESGQTSVPPVKANSAKYDKICRTLHGLFPSQQDIDIVVNGTPGSYFLMSQFYPFRAILEGRHEPADSAAGIPPVTAHPAVLARRLLGLCVCMQQLTPTFNFEQLQLRTSVRRAMGAIISAVTDLVASNEDLVATAEGLQCLVILGLWHSNAGNLRKAWLNFRRALSFGQLIGIDRGNYQALRYVGTDVEHKPAAEDIWYRIVACDRSLSLLLGLPVGSNDDSFALEENTRRDTTMERLEKVHTVVAAKIIERNNDKSSQAYAMTQAIDCELEAAARTMEQEWWDEPDIAPVGLKNVQTLGVMVHLMLQVHHFDLLVLLHLPFMLRDPNENRYDYSKATCARASREVLRRYIKFRNIIDGASSCRHVDYSGFIASMTLLLTYLRQNPTQPFPSCQQRAEDRKLIEVVRERMQHIAVLNHDKLSQESADVIGQMMPILDSVDASVMGDVSECGTTALKCLHLNVPYLGTVNIHPSIGERQPVQDAAAPGALPTTPLNIYSMNVMPNHVSPNCEAAASALPDTMDFAALDPGLGTSSMNGMFMEFEPQAQTDMFDFPGLTAEAEDWAFQGVDTSYWALINNVKLNNPS